MAVWPFQRTESVPVSYPPSVGSTPVSSDFPPGSPLWQLHALSSRLRARDDDMVMYDEYYRGVHPLAFAGTKYRTAYGGLFRNWSDNWCPLVVDATKERMEVGGFRLGEDSDGDRDAWTIWQRNALDADSRLAHLEALVHGETSVLVWPDANGKAEISLEHPRQAIVGYVPGSRRTRAAGLKQWRDDDGYLYATLYTPEFVWKYRSREKVEAFSSSFQWEQREVDDEPWPLPHPFGVVPLVTLYNRPRLMAAGESEIKNVIPLQRAVNKLVADMLVASEFGAFRQRWATGLDVIVDPKTNKPIEPFDSSADHLWLGTSAETQFGEFSPTELSNFVAGIETIVQHIASQTRTPPHYFYLSGQFPSGEAIKSAEAGLVAKSRYQMGFFGESWEEIMRLAFRAEGDDAKAAVMNSEVIWADPEYHSESERMDALTKLASLGVHPEILWEKGELTPAEIIRNKKLWADQGIGPEEIARMALSRAASAATSGNGTPPAA